MLYPEAVALEASQEGGGGKEEGLGGERSAAEAPLCVIDPLLSVLLRLSSCVDDVRADILRRTVNYQ